MNQTDSQPVEKPPILLRPLLNRKYRRITLAVLAGVILLGGAIWYWLDSRSIIDHQLVAEADFTVYAPKQAPAGYSTDDDRTSLKGDILTYSFTSQLDDKDITVTVQDKPDGFDMSQISKDGSVNTISTPNGMLYNLSIGGATQYLLDTGESLVYITSASSIDNSAIVDIANSLHKHS